MDENMVNMVKTSATILIVPGMRSTPQRGVRLFSDRACVWCIICLPFD